MWNYLKAWRWLGFGLLLGSWVACGGSKQGDPAVDMSVASSDLRAPGGDLGVVAGDLAGALADANTAVFDDLTASNADLIAPSDLTSSSTDLAASSNVTWLATGGLPSTACAPWTLTETTDTETPQLGNNVLTIATSTDSEFMIYSHPDTKLITPATLVIEARMRFVSGASTNAARTAAAIGFRIGPNRKRNTLYIGDGEIFLLNDSGKGASASVATKDAMHTYRIEVDTTTGAITVARDGEAKLTGATFEVSDSLAATIFFGDSNGSASGTSEWERFSHNAYTPISCP